MNRSQGQKLVLCPKKKLAPMPVQGVNRVAEQARAGNRGIEEESLLLLPDPREIQP